MTPPLRNAFPLPGLVAEVLDAVCSRGRPFITGGAVRDWLLGKESKDLDVEVFGCSWDSLISVLRQFGKVDLVGKSFGVAKLQVAGHEMDFSLPRSERKTANGHRGFSVTPDPDMDPAKAASRRDFTLNAISYDWQAKNVFDPLHGEKDLSHKILRHCSDAFFEDPLRVLRGFQFSSRFVLEPAEETIEMCRRIRDQFSEISVERVWMEWEKWATKSLRPSQGLKFLKATGWLEHFPLIAAMDGCPQDPEWHPEGNVLEHTAHCLDAMAQNPLYLQSSRLERLTLMFAALVHDIGKPATTIKAFKKGAERWVSPGHDRTGMDLAEKFLLSIAAPRAIIPHVQALVGSHMAAIHIRKRPSLPQVRRLARKVQPAFLEQLFAVIRADLAGRPPIPPRPSQGLLWLEEASREEALNASAPQPVVLGRHLIDRGLQPGKHFKPILDQLFDLQLDGAFSNLEEAEPHIRRICNRYLTQSG